MTGGSNAVMQVAGIPISVGLILVVELCERFCFYTIQGSQKFFLSQNLGYNNAQSTSITNVFYTLCYLNCLGGGVLGDRFFGRYMTISSLAAVYVAGAFILAFSTNPNVMSSSMFFIGAFCGVAVGTGGIKPLVCNFGADQIQGEGVEKTKERFFSLFYWMINIGAAIGLGVMTTLATSPETFGVAAGYGYFWSYLIAAMAMAFCVCLFLTGSCVYSGKFLTRRVHTFRPVCSVMWHSAKQSLRGKVCMVGWLLLIPFFTLSFVQAFAEEGSSSAQVLAWLAFGTALVQLACLIWSHCDNSFLVPPPGMLEDSGDEGQMPSASLSDIRLTFQTLPILLMADTVFNFAYSMMMGPFLSESCQMKLTVGSSNMQISGAFFNLADSLAIIICIPIFERFVFPAIERCRGRPVQVHEKLFGGFFWAALGMVAAIILEYSRRAAPVLSPAGWSSSPSPANFPGMTFYGDGSHSWEHFQTMMGTCVVEGIDYCSNCAPKVNYPFCDPSTSTCHDTTVKAGIYMSDLAGWWMFVPFSFIGIGEILVMPVLYHYAYSLTPTRTQSVIQAVNLVFQGAYPPALVGVFSTVLASAQPNNLNNGHLEVFYYISLVIIALGVPIFFQAKKACQIVTPVRTETDGNVALVSDRAGDLIPTSMIGSRHSRAVSGTTSFLPRDFSNLSASVAGGALGGSWIGPQDEDSINQGSGRQTRSVQIRASHSSSSC